MLASATIRGEYVQSFVPLPKQKLFIYHVEDNPVAKFVWYCGGFGSGKSFIGSHEVIRLAMKAPNGRSLIARQTLVDLKATTMKTFFEVLDRRLIRKWNKSENLLTLINGHEVYFWGLDDIEKLKSLEIGTFWIDEVNEVEENTFNVLKGRLRHRAHPKRVGLLTSNSEGKNWTYKQFVLGKGIRTEKDLSQYYVIKAPSDENRYLPQDYLDILNSYTGDLYERYVKASWNVFEGQIFPDFDREIHVIKPFAIPDTWKRFGGIDHGERNPSTYIWVAAAPNGDLYVYREYVKTGEFVDQHVKNIYELNDKEEIERVDIDPSTKSVRGGSGRKVDTEYKEEWQKVFGERMPIHYANNDVAAGIARMHKYLRVDPSRVHPATKKQGAPRIFWFDTCTVSIDEMEGYKWKKISPSNENDPEEAPRKKDDHTVDPTRYIIMGRPDFVSGGVMSKTEKEKEAKMKDPNDQLLEIAMKNNPGDFIKL